MNESSSEYPYVNHMDLRYGPLELIDVQRLAAECTEAWYNRSLCEVNDSVVRLGVIRGEYHWHHHDDEDEMFLVLDGVMEIHLRDGVVRLSPGEFFVVPRGVEHKPVVPEAVASVLLFEPSSTRNTGNVEHEYTIEAGSLEKI